MVGMMVVLSLNLDLLGWLPFVRVHWRNIIDRGHGASLMRVIGKRRLPNLFICVDTHSQHRRSVICVMINHESQRYCKGGRLCRDECRCVNNQHIVENRVLHICQLRHAFTSLGFKGQSKCGRMRGEIIRRPQLHRQPRTLTAPLWEKIRDLRYLTKEPKDGRARFVVSDRSRVFLISQIR